MVRACERQGKQSAGLLRGRRGVPKAVIPRHTSKLNATAPCHSNCPLATAKKAGASKMSENGTTESVCLRYTVVCSALTALILPSVRGLKGLM